MKFEMPAGYSRADVIQEGSDALCWELLPNRGCLNNYWLELCFLPFSLMSGWPWTCLFGSLEYLDCGTGYSFQSPILITRIVPYFANFFLIIL